jgi:oligopeptide/dipeptide ABC transporter ATP-binding protein
LDRSTRPAERSASAASRSRWSSTSAAASPSCILCKIVAIADKTALFPCPQHPYAEALLSAVPIPDPEAAKKRISLKGDVPSPINPPSGCRFHTRCPYASDRCSKEEPAMREVMPGHHVACHLREVQNTAFSEGAVVPV